MKNLSREQIKQVKCPACKAPPGEPCKREGKSSHLERMQVAQEIILGAAIQNRIGQSFPVTVSYLPGREPVKKVKPRVKAERPPEPVKFTCKVCLDLGFTVVEQRAKGARTVPCKCRAGNSLPNH